MADDSAQENENDKSNAGLASGYVRRARKLLTGEDETALSQAQAYIELANVHATLELADALRQAKSE